MAGKEGQDKASLTYHFAVVRVPGAAKYDMARCTTHRTAPRRHEEPEREQEARLEEASWNSPENGPPRGWVCVADRCLLLLPYDGVASWSSVSRGLKGNSERVAHTPTARQPLMRACLAGMGQHTAEP
jgi:hypothetical protein